MIQKTYVKTRKVFKVTFELPKDEIPQEVAIEDVSLVGEFNDWTPAATPMKRGKKGVYKATVELTPGSDYQFRYLVNGEHWCNDWNADGYAPGGFGVENSIVAIPQGA